MLKKIYLICACSAVLAILAYFAWLNHNNFESSMVAQAQEQLLATANSEAQSIEEYISNLHRELEILSGQEAIINALKGAPGPGIRALEDSFRDIKRLADSLLLIDERGVVIGAVPEKGNSTGENLSQLADVKLILTDKTTYTSGVFESSGTGMVIAHLHPVFEGEKFLGFLRVLISVERIHKLVSQVNQPGKPYAILIDNNASLLSYPDTSYIGKNIYSLANGSSIKMSMPALEALVEKMLSGSGGKGFDERLIFAYTPIYFNSELWSLAVLLDYQAIALPVNRNARENLIFSGFVLAVFTIFGLAFYRLKKQEARRSVSEAALGIINKQLHLEIEERKHIEELLQNALCERKPPKHSP